MSAKKPARASKKTVSKKVAQKSVKTASKPAKKVVAKKRAPAPAKKPAKSAKKAPASKSVSRAPVKAKKNPATTKTAKSRPVAKKSSGNLIKAAANKLKQTFSKSPIKKAAPASKSRTQTQAAKSSQKAVSNKPGPLTSLSSKGLPTEAQIRRMAEKDYMNDVQLNFFRHRLLQMREEVLAREVDVKERLHQREIFADPADRATAEEEHWLDLRLRERESLLLRKIDEALRRIAEREFGYCEKTGDAIGIPRLLARPTATVCVDVKGQDERIESQFRDR